LSRSQKTNIHIQTDTTENNTSLLRVANCMGGKNYNIKMAVRHCICNQIWIISSAMKTSNHKDAEENCITCYTMDHVHTPRQSQQSFSEMPSSKTTKNQPLHPHKTFITNNLKTMIQLTTKRIHNNTAIRKSIYLYQYPKKSLKESQYAEFFQIVAKETH